MTGFHCYACHRDAMVPATIDYRSQARLERVTYDIHVPELPVLRCESCGEVSFNNSSDRAIDEAVRRAAGLLQASEIREGRRVLGLTQRELASLAGCAPTQLSRWEKGHVVQSRMADRLLRLVFGVPEAREMLDGLRRAVAARTSEETSSPPKRAAG